MRVVVPFAAETPKTRLADVLSGDERRGFAEAMLADVLTAVSEAGETPEVLSTAPLSVEADLGLSLDAAVTVDDRRLTPAVNAVVEETDGPVAVVMADLAIATPDALSRLFATDGDVVVAPGRGGGTNALVVREPAFRVDYHGASFLDHLRAAEDVGGEVAVVDSHRLATDVDTRSDLVEVLIHGEGRARTWLEEAGFELAIESGRVDVRRG